ncbi:MAG: DUF1553 domain-containing protein [Fimbriimonadaceae bacterium]|nr:DUF1553 domain-containing protein [Fimbriimonadaceae bacterium]
MRRLRWAWAVAGLVLTGRLAVAQQPTAAPVEPFEQATWAVAASPIDQAVTLKHRQRGVVGALPCSDVVFCRRVYLDVIGTLPEPAEVTAFLADQRPGKRAHLIDALLARDEYADYWALKWCDVLRVKAEFPVNLWPNAVQAYHRWLRDSMAANKPYDQFVRELLTSSGSNFRVPPVNFYRAVQGKDAAAIAEVVALTWMGTRLAAWPADERAQLLPWFSRVVYKATGEWKEEIVCVDPKATTPLVASLPGTAAKISVPPEGDPRAVFADWLIQPDNPWFARNLCNRVWSWMLGRGVVHEVDDLRPDNPPANPELLETLEQILVQSKWDLQALLRAILNSRAYQQSSIPRAKGPTAEALCAWYPVRRLDAEVLADALVWLTGSGETYSSSIPEPFTYLPEDQRTIQLADGSITSPFLEMFGRPPRDTGYESERNNQPSDEQRLYLLNSSDVQRRLERSPRLIRLQLECKGNYQTLIRGLYLTMLSREPTAAELKTAETYAKSGLRMNEATNDLAWSLLNTKEFLYRH